MVLIWQNSCWLRATLFTGSNAAPRRSILIELIIFNRTSGHHGCRARRGHTMRIILIRPDFLRDNLLIQDNVIDAAYRSGVEKFVFLGSSCIYPKLAPAAHQGGLPAHRAAGADQ